MNILSESATWRATLEFVDANGNISAGIGEYRIKVTLSMITNESWMQLDAGKIINNYQIFKSGENCYCFHSDNAELGIRKGFLNVERNVLFSKFLVEGTDLNGFEVITRNRNQCHGKGAIYLKDNLVKTWTSMMVKNASGDRVRYN